MMRKGMRNNLFKAIFSLNDEKCTSVKAFLIQ